MAKVRLQRNGHQRYLTTIPGHGWVEIYAASNPNANACYRWTASTCSSNGKLHLHAFTLREMRHKLSQIQEGQH